MKDSNNVDVGMAYDGLSVVPLKVFPATGELIVDILAYTPTGTPATGNAKRDENHVTTALAYNGTTYQPLTMVNDRLLIELI